ncbi:T9SS type A sorting domain-containing protein [Epilithonimonas sp.]|uniref:T9SS type A sorting domain-containing protein n=1 Tax=Epilithonimonas sp. TaxID=2894511 RepID=UPI002FDE7A70
MKKSFLFIFTVITINLGFGQTNPVQNVEWNYNYDFMNYTLTYSLYWNEPALPRNELIGYNIYRGNELYRFQTSNSLACNPYWGGTDCDFLEYNNGAPFTIYVAAVYNGNVESEYISAEFKGHTLDITDSPFKLLSIFPNPTKETLNFSEELSSIKITDLSGKIIKQISNSEKSVNVLKLAKGTYIINATTKTGETITKKFIKE